MTEFHSALLIAVMSGMVAAVHAQTPPANPEAPPGLKLSETQAELANLYTAGRLPEFQRRALEIVSDPNLSTSLRVAAFNLVLAIRRTDNRIPVDLLDRCHARLVERESNPSDEVRYVLDHYRIDQLQFQGDLPGAAVAARELRQRLESESDRVAMVYSEEPVLYCRAGDREAALKLVSETWLRSPNHYQRNEAVRLRLAEYLNDVRDVDTAFRLLDELRESFPAEFQANPYAFQNWLNYSVRAQLGESDTDRRRRLLDIAEAGAAAVTTKAYERMRAEVNYCVAQLYEKAQDTSSAIDYYNRALESAGDGEMANNLRKWSQGSITRLQAPETQVQPAAPAAAPMRSSPLRFVVLINIIAVCVLLAFLTVWNLVRKSAVKRGSAPGGQTPPPGN